MEPQGDSIVLEEEIDPNYEPTEKEVLEYATWLGMDLEAERDLFWIAREGLKAPLPENWKPCKTTDTEEIYYFNFTTGESTWDHPCDEFYRNLYDEHKDKRQTNDVQETDEKKKKAKDDVAELLGRKGGKKKKSAIARAEPLGGPSLGKATGLEKKPLPGLSGKLGSLGPSGFGGGLKPVAGLGALKSEAKELGGPGIGLDSADSFKSDGMSKPLSRGPLTNVLGKKPLLSSPSVSSAGMSETKSNAGMTSDFEEKRERLAQEHAVKLREIQDSHEIELESLRKKLKAQMEDVQDAEELTLKQLKRELDKKKNHLEDQFDREENTLQRSRKDQLKRLEADTEDALSHKKRDLDRELKSEIDKIQLKNEAKQREIQEGYDQEAEQLTERMKVMLGDKKEAVQLVTELKAEVERLKDQQNSLSEELCEVRKEKDILLQDKQAVEKDRDEAQRDTEELRRQISELKRSESSTSILQECTKCIALNDQVSYLKTECNVSKEQLGNVQKELAVLMQELQARTASEGAENDAVATFREQDGMLKQEIATLQQQLASLEADSGDLRSKCAAFQSEKDAMGQIQTSSAGENQQIEALQQQLASAQAKCAALQFEKDAVAQSQAFSAGEIQQLEALQKQLSSAQADVANTKRELSDLRDQHSVTQTTNAQIKEQLMKELNEGKALREQLDSKAEEVTQLTTEMKACQQQLQSLQQQMESELRTRRDQEGCCDALGKQIHDLEQAKSKVEAKLGELESERHNHESEMVDSSGEKVRLIDLEMEASRLIDRQRSLEEELNTVRSDKDALLQNKIAAETALTKAQRDVAELRQQLSEATRPGIPVALSQECTKCSAWEDRVASLESEYAQTQSEAEKLRKELVVTKEETQVRMAAVHESAKAAAATLKREKDDAVNALRDQESLLKREIAGLQEKLSALEGDSSKLRATCGSLQNEIDTAGRRRSDMSSSVSATQEQLKSLERQLAAAQTEVTSTKTELHDLQHQHAAILTTNTQMKEQLEKEFNAKKLLHEQLDVHATEAVERLKTTGEKHQQQILSLQQQLEPESHARRELEGACDALRKEMNVLEQAKRKRDTEFVQLESDKRHLESEKSILSLRLEEMGKSRKRDEKSVVSVEEALADKKLEAELLRANLKVSETDKEHLEARMKALNQEFEQLLAKTHRLEGEYESERVRCRTIEKERDAVSQKQQSTVDELETSQRKSRTLVTEVSELQGLLTKTKAAEQASSSKVEQIGQEIRQMEQQKERDEFALKMKLQQAEVDRENVNHAKERAELQLLAREKELASAKDEITRTESEIESMQARVKSLLSDKEEVQAALQNANMASVASASVNRESTKPISASTDVMLVKLQLADANRNELELHLADISSQLEHSTRRCASLETRCRDQAVEIESLHVEVASLRSASQKMHMSALETLVLVERLEYEHKKRTLRSDFLNQLRDFQGREEKVLVRHKARLRAQYERHLEDLVAELEKVRQQRVEQEEALSVQVVEQIRQEREAKRTEAKRQVREELKHFEQELHERKVRDIEIISKAIEKEEDELGARLREVRQVAREEELSKQPGRDGDTAGTRDRLTLASPGQLLNRRSTLRGRPESLDEDGDDNFQAPAAGKQTKSSNQLQHLKKLERTPDRRQKKNLKTYKKWKQRLQEEVELLVNARTLVSNQRQGLTNQAQQLKASKNEWKRDSRSAQANPIQREVKRMLDENMANWSEGMRKLRKQETWIKQREEKLSKMKRTVNRLKRRNKYSYDHDNNLSGRSESSSSEDGEEARAVWSDSSNESELASTLEKLERLEGELAFDAGSFSEAFPRDADDGGRGSDFHAVYQMPPSYALQREPAYRYPLTSSLGIYAPRRATMHSAGDAANHDVRYIRSQRTAFGLRGDRFAATPMPIGANRSEQVYHQKISRWAKGRERMQHAATSHATWLSGLCDELKEYGAKYTRAEEGEVEFLPDDEEEAAD